jgi:hypothetical protein
MNKLTPATEQWNTIKKMWPSIDYAKLSDDNKANFLRYLGINPGFGHPPTLANDIELFITKKSNTLSDEVIAYYKQLEPRLLKQLNYGN